MNVAAMQQDTSATSGTDTEVSQINEPKTPLETADFAAMSANTQVIPSKLLIILQHLTVLTYTHPFIHLKTLHCILASVK